MVITVRLVMNTTYMGSFCTPQKCLVFYKCVAQTPDWSGNFVPGSISYEVHGSQSHNLKNRHCMPFCSLKLVKVG